MNSPVHTAIIAFLRAHPIEPGTPVIVAVSGGADSLSLLLGLVDLSGDLGLGVRAAHVHHGMRADADRDVERLRELCDSLGIPLDVGYADVPAIAAENRVSLEVAGRTARYRFLFETAANVGGAVCTGHTRDDQAETVLLRILSGTGIEGLGGIAPERLAVPPESPAPVRILHPILTVSRSDTAAFCEERGLEVVDDPYNADLCYPRNRIRHSLLPLLEREYNPAVRDALVRLSDLARADNAALADIATQAAEKRRSEPGRMAWSLETFHTLPLALQRRVARVLLARAGGSGRALGFENVERLLAALSSGRARVSLDGGLDLLVRDGQAELNTPSQETPSLDYEIPLPIPGQIETPAGTLIAEIVSDRGQEQTPWEAWLDADRLGSPLVRNRRPGDTIQPHGMAGHRKVSDVMSEKRVPRSLRDGLPLVISGGTVAWVAGVKTSEAFRVRPDMRRIVHLRFLPCDAVQAGLGRPAG